MILYLHGFRSSPHSFKARVVGEKMAALGLAGELLCPQLPASPKAAIELALRLLEPHLKTRPLEQLAIIGSSLGGYYATWLAEHLGCRAALLNPAVYPLKDLEQHVGVTTEYHSDKPFEFRPEYIGELGALAVTPTRPERYFLLAASGDEVLDYRDMLAHYAGARQHVIDGSDHALADFPRYVDEVLAFCMADGKR